MKTHKQRAGSIFGWGRKPAEKVVENSKELAARLREMEDKKRRENDYNDYVKATANQPLKKPKRRLSQRTPTPIRRNSQASGTPKWENNVPERSPYKKWGDVPLQKEWKPPVVIQKDWGAEVKLERHKGDPVIVQIRTAKESNYPHLDSIKREDDRYEMFHNDQYNRIFMN
jgi:hypothetical protein